MLAFCIAYDPVAFAYGMQNLFLLLLLLSCCIYCEVAKGANTVSLRHCCVLLQYVQCTM